MSIVQKLCFAGSGRPACRCQHLSPSPVCLNQCRAVVQAGLAAYTKAHTVYTWAKGAVRFWLGLPTAITSCAARTAARLSQARPACQSSAFCCAARPAMLPQIRFQDLVSGPGIGSGSE